MGHKIKVPILPRKKKENADQTYTYHRKSNNRLSKSIYVCMLKHNTMVFGPLWYEVLDLKEPSVTCGPVA